MKNISDKSIDMILCDLPYGTSACKWDFVIPFEDMWKQYDRIIKDDGAIVLFGSEPFSSYLRTSNIKMYKYDWKWKKDKGANFLNSNYQPLKIHEDILVFGKMATSFSRKGNMKYNKQLAKGKPFKVSKKEKTDKVSSNIRSELEYKRKDNNGTRYPTTILEFSLDKEKSHPTQKPVPLLEYLIKTYTNEGETVLDNCMGSGSTGVACLNTNRRFIGIELNKEYYDIAYKRILG